MQNNTNISTKEKRKLLQAMSTPLKALIQMGAISSINEGLINSYRNDTHKEFHSYVSWRNNGYQVKLGEKAFLIWGTPILNNKDDKTNETEPKAEQTEPKENEDSYYPLAYIFSNAQVELIETKQNKSELCR